MLSNSLSGPGFRPSINPFKATPAFPNSPRIAPDQFRPTPSEPTWLPMPKQMPSIPQEFPASPEGGSWITVPTAPEVPNWSEMPWNLPQPNPREITIPTKPGLPKTYPDGVWLLS